MSNESELPEDPDYAYYGECDPESRRARTREFFRTSNRLLPVDFVWTSQSPWARASFEATIPRLVPKVGYYELLPWRGMPKPALVYRAWRLAMRLWRKRIDTLLASPAWAPGSRVRENIAARRFTARNCRPACASIVPTYRQGVLVVRRACRLSCCPNCWARVVARCYRRFECALYRDPRIAPGDPVPTWYRPSGPFRAVPRVRFVDADPDPDYVDMRATPAFHLLDRRVARTVVDDGDPARGRLRAVFASRHAEALYASSRFESVGVHGGAERTLVARVDPSPDGSLTWHLEHRMLLLVAPDWDPARMPRPVVGWMEDDPAGRASTKVVPIRHCGDLARAVAAWGELEPLAYSGSVDYLAALMEARHGLPTRKSFGFLRPPQEPVATIPFPLIAYLRQGIESMPDVEKNDKKKKLPPRPALVLDKFIQKVKDIPAAPRDSWLVDFLIEWLDSALSIPNTPEEVQETVKGKSIRLRQLFNEVMLEGEAESTLRDSIDIPSSKKSASPKAPPVAKPKLEAPVDDGEADDEEKAAPAKKVAAPKAPAFESLAGRWVTYKVDGVSGLTVGQVTEDNGKKLVLDVVSPDGTTEPWPNIDRNAVQVANDAKDAKSRARLALEEAQAIADAAKAEREAKKSTKPKVKVALPVEDDDDDDVEDDDDVVVDDDAVEDEEELAPKPAKAPKKPSVVAITLPTPTDVMARFKAIAGRERHAPKFKGYEARFEEGDTVAVAQYNLDIGEKSSRRLIVYAVNAITTDPNGLVPGHLILSVLKSGAKSAKDVDESVVHEPIVSGIPGPYRLKIGRTLCDLTFAVGDGEPFYKADLFEDV